MPAEPQVHLQLARAYDALGQHFASVDQYQQLTRLAPRDPEYVYLLARSWADLSRSSLKEIAKLDSNSVRLHQALSLELWNQGKYDEALSSFQKAADVDPKLPDRKSTRLNSSHLVISYAVFCLKKKKISII